MKKFNNLNWFNIGGLVGGISVIILMIYLVSILIGVVTAKIEHSTREKIELEQRRADMITKIKRDCESVHSDITKYNITYTYRCENRREYTFMERI